MLTLTILATVLATAASAAAEPALTNPANNVTYQGFLRNGVEMFLGVPYAKDTGGENRFKPPEFAAPENGSTINATAYGPACPQALGKPGLFPLYITNVTEISEDCLNLNIARPNGTEEGAQLPVYVWIHGGSFWSGFNGDISNAPDEMILQSVDNHLPIIHVGINYRLGAFGFAQNKALYDEGSLNAGLRDQRLAIEWTRDNIAMFGGDPDQITVGGQSSGGLAVGMQIVAYGGSKPAPFQQAICESQALEPGITGNFTYHQMDLLAEATGCNTSALDSNSTIACLRNLTTEVLLNASIATYSGDVSNNIGDCWLPVVDGDFLPDAPSALVSQNRMANLSAAIIGWADDDLGFFTPRTIETDNDTKAFITSYLPKMNDSSVAELMALYPVSDFPATPSANLSQNFHRSARIFRDVLMTCMPSWMGSYLATRQNTSVFLYDQNATVLTPLVDFLGSPGLGPVHTSEFAYVFGNLSHYNLTDIGVPGFDPTPEDYVLAQAETRSWSSFVATGQPGLVSRGTLQNWGVSFVKDESAEAAAQNWNVYVVGGAEPGLASVTGGNSSSGDMVMNEVLVKQKLAERCAFFNSEAIIQQLQF